MDTLIRAGALLTPDGTIAPGDLLVRDGKIHRLGGAGEITAPAGARRIDAAHLQIAPGFIDAHTHGGAGFDFMSAGPEELLAILRWLPSTGVTAALATVSSSPLEETLAMVARLRATAEAAPPGARLLGIHLEGPYLADARRGAQPAAGLRLPDREELAAVLSAAGGWVRSVTLAPELPGALELTGWLAGQGIVVSLGHSEASEEQGLAAAAAGARRVTHLFNGMPELAHRAPGLAGAALTDDRLYAELILDGIHVAPGAARVALRCKGVRRLVLVTDATQAAGLGDGVYMRPGNRKITVQDGAARLENGSLAGSVLTLDRAVANAARWLGLPYAEAARLAGQTAAESLGLGEQYGRLAPEMPADLVAVDAEYHVAWTMVAGDVLYEK